MWVNGPSTADAETMASQALSEQGQVKSEPTDGDDDDNNKSNGIAPDAPTTDNDASNHTANNNAAAQVFSIRDKVQWLNKMPRFESSMESSLQTMFLEMVYKVFLDKNVSDQEKKSLEMCFLMGLRSRSLAIRRNFFAIFNQVGKLFRVW